MLDAAELMAALQPYVRVHRALTNRLSVYCPFHPTHAPGTERRPSMSIYLDSGFVICFTCGYRGWVDRLLIERGMQASQARDYAEVMKGLKQTPIRTDDAEHEQRATSLAQMVGKYQHLLPKNLLDAGFKQATLDKFRVGYDPINQRVTYPIYDKHSSLVAIVGGAISKEQFPKYKLYEEEVGLEPGVVSQRHRDHLWGFDILPPSGPYVIVEGYKACMWVHQCGFPAVATQGTSFTEAQVSIITSTYRDVAILYDNDGAGRAAASKLHLTLLGRMGPKTRLIEYPKPDPSLQPDSMTGAELLQMIG